MTNNQSMMKFFRTIRQTSLTENKFSKYLIYAIGEIILVVIGILIALQVNNLNENKQIEALEISLLKEMLVNLQADIHDMRINIGYHERSIQSAKIILYSFENELLDNDTLHTHYAIASMLPRFLITKNAYNSIDREGMRIIQNDSLRNAITNHYEQTTTFLTDWNDADWENWRQDHREMYRQYFKEFSFFDSLVPTNYYDLSTNSQYKNYLNNRISWFTLTNNLYEKSGINSAEKLINLIKKELKKRAE
jgi:hypothetical protein|tara:strand:- start:40 stop:789 length:750 start_codon:yes stop_codon:yes gene_type:complete